MFASTFLASFVLLVHAVLVHSAALPSPDETGARIAPRSVVSGGVNCYFSCPATIPGPPGSSTAVLYTSSSRSLPNNGGAYCYYQTARDANYRVFDCTYNGAGVLTSAVDRNGYTCPRNAPSAGCGTDSVPNSYNHFKREKAAPRKLSSVERAIKLRQYKPKSLR